MEVWLDLLSQSLVYTFAGEVLKPYLGQVEDRVHVDGDGDERLVLVDACTAQPSQLHGSLPGLQVWSLSYSDVMIRLPPLCKWWFGRTLIDEDRKGAQSPVLSAVLCQHSKRAAVMYGNQGHIIDRRQGHFYA